MAVGKLFADIVVGKQGISELEKNQSMLGTGEQKMANEKRTCNQMCRWNDSSDGCIKPENRTCPMSNTEPDASGWGQVQVANEQRLIDANALLEKAYWRGERATVYNPYPIGEEVVDVSDVESAPTVDAVEVVRCKDCKWYERDTDYAVDVTTGKRDFSKIVEKPYGECQGQNFHFTEDGFLRVGNNDFCSYGERREGE